MYVCVCTHTCTRTYVILFDLVEEADGREELETETERDSVYRPEREGHYTRRSAHENGAQ